MKERIDSRCGNGEILSAKQTNQLSEAIIAIVNWRSHRVMKRWCERVA